MPMIPTPLALAAKAALDKWPTAAEKVVYPVRVPFAKCGLVPLAFEVDIYSCGAAAVRFIDDRCAALPASDRLLLRHWAVGRALMQVPHALDQ